MRNVHIIQSNREPVKGDILLRHLWKNTSNECISWWRYNETVVIDNVKQYTTLNGSFRDAVSSFKLQNIYITANGSFARGAYVTDGIEVMKATPKLVDAQGLVNRRNWRKIILTTDQDLIKDGVQAIDDEFLEWFVKNPSCERVEVRHLLKSIFDPKTNEKYPVVQHRHFDLDKMICEYKYEIIIPKEEPKQELERGITITHVGKQETLEEAAQRIFNGFGDITKPSAIKRALELVKWQQEQDKNKYSEEEVLKLLLNSEEYTSRFNGRTDLKHWFEQIKKK